MKTNGIWVGTSWKMNKTLDEAMAFAEGLALSDAFDHKLAKDAREGAGAAAKPAMARS